MPTTVSPTRESSVDPRVARSREVILRTAAELLVEGGAGYATIERISERSGVAKTTIYRHWPSRSRLVLDAFRSVLEPEAARFLRSRTTPATLRDTLVLMLRGLIRGLTDSPWAPAVSTLVDAADREPEMQQLLHDYLVERMGLAKTLIGSAARSGELASDIDPGLAVDMLVGPLFYRRLVSREPLDPDLAERIIDRFLAGATPR